MYREHLLCTANININVVVYIKLIISKNENKCTYYYICRVVVADVKPRIDNGIAVDDVEIPLPQDQDTFSQLHPYPCDFCSRRFSKKSTLMSHMVSHQTERPHGNCCVIFVLYQVSQK